MKYLYVANWKMYLPYNDAKKWINDHLKTLALQNKHTVIICPSFDILSYASQQCNKHHISLGAQDCSPYASGAYTGQISAASLAELECSHCLVGHSEQRPYLSHDELYKKIEQLITHHITPIICVQNNNEEELAPIVKTLKNHKKDILIAYEPIEAIGSGKVPSNQDIQVVFEKIHAHLTLNKCQKIYHFLYGGSVSAATIQRLHKISSLKGFLIGRASLDIQEFTKILQGS